MNNATTYTREIEGEVQIMIEVAPSEFVNTISAAKLGLIRAEKPAQSYKTAA